MSLSRTISEI